MKRTVFATVLVTVLVGLPPATAHDDPLSFVAVEWSCYAVPIIYRKESPNFQQFEFGNTGSSMLRYFVAPIDPTGKLMFNMDRSSQGALRPGQAIIAFNNRNLQEEDVEIGEEEGADFCFAPDHELIGMGGPFQAPLASVTVRELRRNYVGQWLAFTLQERRRVWLVAKSTFGASAELDVESLRQQMEAHGR